MKQRVLGSQPPNRILEYPSPPVIALRLVWVLPHSLCSEWLAALPVGRHPTLTEAKAGPDPLPKGHPGVL